MLIFLVEKLVLLVKEKFDWIVNIFFVFIGEFGILKNKLIGIKVLIILLFKLKVFCKFKLFFVKVLKFIFNFLILG